MELNNKEGALSDDYEEGEILDEDSLYDNVSSLEEFSCSEGNETDKPQRDSTNKFHRKKEHRCKDNSVCRRDRTGKQCYARLKKKRPSLDSMELKMKNFIHLEPTNPKPANVKSLVNSIGRPMRKPYKKDLLPRDNHRFHKLKIHTDFRERKLPQPYSSRSNRLFRDNRWITSNLPKDVKPKVKPASPKIPHKTSSSKHVAPIIAQPAKTTLLTRLIKSGDVKTLKEQAAESIKNDLKEGEEEENNDLMSETEIVDLTNTSDELSSANLQQIETNNVMTKQEIEAISLPSDDKNENVESKNSKPSPADARNIDELESEWSLRIAALKTALFKKFSEKKKNGFIRKKSSNLDDSIVDYVLQEDREEGEDNSIKQSTTECLKDVDYRNFTDQPCDMEICDTQPTVIEQDFNLSLKEHNCFLNRNGIECQDSPQDNIVDIQKLCAQTNVSETPSSSFELVQEPAIVDISTQPLVPNCLKEINSNNKTVRLRKEGLKRFKRKRRTRKRKLRKGLIIGNHLVKRNVVLENERETQEEFELRKLALMSVKARSKIAEGMLVKVNPESKLLKTLHVDTNHLSPSLGVSNASAKLVSNNSSTDPWEDVDEDILRAQLLSSLSSKIPSKEINSQPVFSPSQKSPNTLKISPNTQIPHMNGLHKKFTKDNLKAFSTKSISELKRLANEKEKFLTRKRFIKNTAQPKLLPPISGPIVEKFIINVSNDSESSEEEEEKLPLNTVSPDISASIDFLLQEVRNKTEQEQINGELNKLSDQPTQETNLKTSAESNNQVGASTKIPADAIQNHSQNSGAEKTETKVTEGCPAAPASDLKCILSPKEPFIPPIPDKEKIPVPSSTPQGIRHLPAWQQEEYRRLKKKLAEKELLWKATKSKLVTLKTENEQMKSPCESDESSDKNAIKDSKRPLTECASDKAAKQDTENTPNKQETESDNEENTDSSNTSPVQANSELVHNTKRQNVGLSVGKESWQYSKDFTDMSTMVDRMEKDLEEFQQMKLNTARLKKELALAHNKLIKKKRILVLAKDALENKEKSISQKLNTEFPLPEKNETTEQQKLNSRDLELVKLKFKEVSLRAQFACFNISKEIKQVDKSTKSNKNNGTIPPSPKRKLKPDDKTSTNGQVPLKKEKLNLPIKNGPMQIPPENKTSSSSQQNQQTHVKRIIRVSESRSLDPFTPLCPFDMSGVCKDEECKYQHIKTT